MKTPTQALSMEKEEKEEQIKEQIQHQEDDYQTLAFYLVRRLAKNGGVRGDGHCPRIETKEGVPQKQLVNGFQEQVQLDEIWWHEPRWT